MVRHFVVLVFTSSNSPEPAPEDAASGRLRTARLKAPAAPVKDTNRRMRGWVVTSVFLQRWLSRDPRRRDDSRQAVAVRAASAVARRSAGGTGETRRTHVSNV